VDKPVDIPVEKPVETTALPQINPDIAAEIRDLECQILDLRAVIRYLEGRPYGTRV
jgi:hypothetical protein